MPVNFRPPFDGGGEVMQHTTHDPGPHCPLTLLLYDFVWRLLELRIRIPLQLLCAEHTIACAFSARGNMDAVAVEAALNAVESDSDVAGLEGSSDDELVAYHEQYISSGNIYKRNLGILTEWIMHKKHKHGLLIPAFRKLYRDELKENANRAPKQRIRERDIFRQWCSKKPHTTEWLPFSDEFNNKPLEFCKFLKKAQGG